MRGHRGGLQQLDLAGLAAIFTGGMLGVLARAGLDEALPPVPGSWPWATFAVNLAGAFVLGYAAVRLPLASRRRPFVTAGFCGALTTFSTLQLELLQMLDAGVDGLALGYATATLAGGLAAVSIATHLARRPRAAT
jgi:CrcB protein